jgi:hypothetical protein
MGRFRRLKDKPPYPAFPSLNHLENRCNTVGSCAVVVSGYAGLNTYQLVSTASLTAPSWQNVGSSQSIPATQVGPVSVTLTDPAPVGGSKFYRVVATASP